MSCNASWVEQIVALRSCMRGSILRVCQFRDNLPRTHHMTSSSLTKTTMLERIKNRTNRFFGPWGIFFKGFIKHPMMVGSIIPSSSLTVKKMLAHADYILSGLLFSTLPNNLGPVIAAETAKAIRPGGAFLVYQFRARARDFMAPHFAKIDKGFELWNILPCHLFWGWKE